MHGIHMKVSIWPGYLRTLKLIRITQIYLYNHIYFKNAFFTLVNNKVQTLTICINSKKIFLLVLSWGLIVKVLFRHYPSKINGSSNLIRSYYLFPIQTNGCRINFRKMTFTQVCWVDRFSDCGDLEWQNLIVGDLDYFAYQ